MVPDPDFLAGKQKNEEKHLTRAEEAAINSAHRIYAPECTGSEGFPSQSQGGSAHDQGRAGDPSCERAGMNKKNSGEAKAISPIEALAK